MLQSFTLSYPDSDQVGPKIIVVFTNFSRFDSTDNGDFSYDEESEGEQNQETAKPQGKDP